MSFTVFALKLSDPNVFTAFHFRNHAKVFLKFTVKKGIIIRVKKVQENNRDLNHRVF